MSDAHAIAALANAALQQLIDASTNNHVWADRYDGDLTDIFALQDEITKKVVAAIEPRLLEAEGMRALARPPADLDAWELVARATTTEGCTEGYTEVVLCHR